MTQEKTTDELLLESAIEIKLNMSYEERIESHENARQLAYDLKKAGEKLLAELEKSS